MPRKAFSLLRKDIVYRHEAFRSGLAEAGFDVVDALARPEPGDLLLIWNRYGDYDVWARRFEAAGATVVVTENGWLGKRWLGSEWFSLCCGHHAGAGSWVVGDDGRWDGWHVGLEPWRIGGEKVILGQRSIGEPGIASPRHWEHRTQAKYGGRIRNHPGTKTDGISLEDDLANCGEALTWASSAALKALMLGIPVRYDFPAWIGASAASRLSDPNLVRSDSARLGMFRRLAWAMWTLDEIRSGLAFRHLLRV
jgi:hypothetical protein